MSDSYHYTGSVQSFAFWVFIFSSKDLIRWIDRTKADNVLHTYIDDKSAKDGLIFKDSLFHNKQVGSSVSPTKAVLSTHNQLHYTSCDHIQKPMTQSCVPVLKIFGHGINLVQPIMLGVSSTNQVHSLLPKYICKGLTYLWSTDLLDTRTFLNMKDSIP